MKIVAFILFMIVMILLFANKPWKHREEEENTSNLPNDEATRRISQAKQNAEDVRNNENEFYH